MYTQGVREFLQKPLVARMSVIDLDGYPHTVPVCFVLDGDDLIVTSVRSTRKVEYIRANSKGAIVIGGDFTDEAGYLLKGEYFVEEDPDLGWLRRTSDHYNKDPEQAARSFARYAQKDMIILRLRVRCVSKVY